MTTIGLLLYLMGYSLRVTCKNFCCLLEGVKFGHRLKSAISAAIH